VGGCPVAGERFGPAAAGVQSPARPEVARSLSDHASRAQTHDVGTRRAGAWTALSVNASQLLYL
jgi:hypothetical protein